MIKKFKIFETLINNTSDNLDEILYHGTSSLEMGEIEKSKFKVSDFYLGENVENIVGHYEETSNDDGSKPIIIVLNVNKLDGELIDDFHGDERQMGQYIFNGNIENAIVKIYTY